MRRLYVAVLALVAACASGGMNTEQAIREAERRGEEIIREVVPDPVRAERALVAQRRIRTAVRRGYDRLDAARREVLALNAEYDAPRWGFERITARLTEKRAVVYEEIIAASLSMRRSMTPEEWREFAEAHSKLMTGR